jgi:hypothetical protein
MYVSPNKQLIICNLKLSRPLNSIKSSGASSRVRWLKGGFLVDDDRDGSPHAALLTIQPPDAAAIPRIFSLQNAYQCEYIAKQTNTVNCCPHNFYFKNYVKN